MTSPANAETVQTATVATRSKKKLNKKNGVKNTVLSDLRITYKKTPMLITGYDGVKTAARDINGAFDLRGLGGLVYVTRAITEPEGDGAYSERVRRAAEETVRELKLCF